MNSEQLTQHVKTAQQGDDAAYGRIIQSYQDIAFHTALRHLGNAQDAEDAAQNAFIEAHTCLHTLRDPCAFPAWFKRIVFKQCDRLWRKRQPMQLEDDAWLMLADRHDTPEQMLTQLQRREAVRRQVRQLPELYRDVALLFYFNGRSTQQIATQLALTLSTVKKRLYTARNLLKEKLEPMSATKQPSQDNTFANRVRFFIALRHNDLTTLRQLVRQDADLLTTQTEWGVAAEGWYLPLGTMAIHLAASHNNLPLLDLVVEAGTDINLPDRSERTPLYHAAHMGQLDAANWLIERGANVNTPASNGQTPLHAAVVRNWPDIVDLLLDAGAETAVSDSQSRTPLDWAIAKNRPALAKKLAGDEAFNSPTAPQPSGTTHIWETGIKLLDLVAPFKWGGKNGLFTPISGIGADVVLCELVHSIANQHNGRAIHFGLELGGFTAASRQMQGRSNGIEPHIKLFFGKEKDSTAKQLHMVEQGAKRVAELAQSQPVLVIAYTHLALDDKMMAAFDKMATHKNVTLLFAGNETIGAEPPHLANLDAAITFDRLRGGEGWWPALDMARSYSKQFENEEHERIAKTAVRLAKRYSDLHLIYKNQGMAGFELPLYDDEVGETAVRARRLHIYLNQPMIVAEPWSATPAQFVPLPDTLTTVDRILHGEFDTTPEADMSKIGQWSPRWT